MPQNHGGHLLRADSPEVDGSVDTTPSVFFLLIAHSKPMCPWGQCAMEHQIVRGLRPANDRQGGDVRARSENHVETVPRTPHRIQQEFLVQISNQRYTEDSRLATKDANHTLEPKSQV